MTTANTTGTRVALVTGGSGGIGSSVVDRLAQDGFAVAVHYAGNAGRAEDLAAKIRAAGGRAITVGGDVADEVAMGAAFDKTEAEFGGIDVVVNTAAIMILSPVATLDLADLDRMHRTNIRGTFVISQLAANRLRAGGALINFSTTVAVPSTTFAEVVAALPGNAPVLSLTKGLDPTTDFDRPSRHAHCVLLHDQV